MHRRDLLVAILVLVISASCSQAADEQPEPASSEPAALPLPRTEVAGALWDGAVTIVGGLTADGAASARADRYDAAANRWEQLPDLPLPLHHAGLAVVRDVLVVVGGYTNGRGEEWRAQAGAYALRPDETRWRTLAPLREPRGALAVAVVDDVVFAIGGVTSAGLTGKVESLATIEGTWQAQPSLARSREHHTAAVLGGRLYAIAGRVPENITAVESFSPGDSAWRREPDLNHSRSGIAADIADGRICVAGGEGPEGTIAPVECFDGEQWATVAQLRHPRHGLAVVARGANLHVVGGGREPGLFVSADHEVIAIDGG